MIIEKLNDDLVLKQLESMISNAESIVKSGGNCNNCICCQLKDLITRSQKLLDVILIIYTCNGYNLIKSMIEAYARGFQLGVRYRESELIEKEFHS